MDRSMGPKKHGHLFMCTNFFLHELKNSSLPAWKAREYANFHPAFPYNVPAPETFQNERKVHFIGGQDHLEMSDRDRSLELL